MKTAAVRTSVLFFVILCLTGCPLHAAGLMAGVSVVNITPPVGVKHSAIGIGGDIDVNTGINDSTYARIVALTDGNERTTIISLDLLGFVSDNVKELLPQELKNTVFCATHDHMGPATVSFTPPDFRYQSDYMTDIEKRIAEAIAATHKEMTPVTVGAAVGTADLSYNKLGGGLGLYLCGSMNPDNIKFEPVDEEVGVIRFDKSDGSPLVILVNYASHPVIAWINHKVSAEYPGFMASYIEEAVGGGAVCVFLQGACGDVQPFESCNTLYSKAQEFGERLARLVLDINATITTRLSEEPSLDFISEIIPLGGRNDLENRPDTTGMTFMAELTVTVIDNRIAFVSGPGEFFVDYQLDLKKRSPLDYTFFLGYSNGYLGYFPTRQAVEENWNKFYSHNMWVEIGAGDKFIEKGLGYIASLTGNEINVSEEKPLATPLLTCHPNPFNPSTDITYVIPRHGMVTMTVYDVNGRLVTTLANGMKAPGNHTVTWHPTEIASGLYICKITFDRTQVVTQKMVLMK